MDKQKQMIEEMAKVLFDFRNAKNCCEEMDCSLFVGREFTCNECRNATILANAGYRKADDLLKELQSMKSDFAKDMLEIKETYEKEVVDLVNEVRKETAEKFAKRLKYEVDFIPNHLFCVYEVKDAITKVAKEIMEGKECQNK